jgi:nicotinamide-nucleotide amidase
MRCEVVAIGTELLLGQIIDTNSSWIGEQLTQIGIDSLYQTKVGDNHSRIVATIKTALERSDAVICCGGLGPTQDDITREAIAEIMGVKLVFNTSIAETIKEMFASRGRSMPDNNLKQAEVPEGASAIPKQPGTAPGLICPTGNKVLYAVPGVPYEMHQMMKTAILPDLVSRAGHKGVIKSRVLKTWGYSESRLAELLENRISELDEAGNPTIAFLASGIEGLKVRITAKGNTEAEATSLIRNEEENVRNLLGDSVFGTDNETMESVIISLLKKSGLSLSLVEITSGGIASTRLSAADPFGEVFCGSIVPRSSSTSKQLLNVPHNIIGTSEGAKQLATAARELFKTDIGLSTTGEHDVVGMTKTGQTYLGIADQNGTQVEQVKLPGDYERVRQFSVISLLNALRLSLCKKNLGSL